MCSFLVIFCILHKIFYSSQTPIFENKTFEQTFKMIYLERDTDFIYARLFSQENHYKKKLKIYKELNTPSNVASSLKHYYIQYISFFEIRMILKVEDLFLMEDFVFSVQNEVFFVN